MAVPVISDITRRGFLGLTAMAGLAGLVACQVDTGQGEAPAATTEVTIPDYAGDLPTEDVNFRWVDSGDLKSVFEKAVLEAFTKKHPNIRTTYDGSGWDTVNQVVPLGIRNGSAHDVFALPQEVPASTAINEGWVQPLDDIIPDFATWRAQFPETALIPGVHVFDGKTYAFPLSSARRLPRMMFYDKVNLADAGYDDPAAQIKTWDDLYEALLAATEKDHTGLMLAGDGLGSVISFLATTAGWRGMGSDVASGVNRGMDMSTGEYIFADDAILEAYEFVEKLVADRLVVPGFLTLTEKDARAQMTAGRAAMIMNGPWDIPAWKASAPEWQYQMGKVPTPTGEGFVLPFVETGANQTFAYKDSKLPSVIGQVYAYMGSPEGQKMMVVLSEGNLQSVFEQSNTDADQPGLLDENARTAGALAKELMRAAPQVELRNAESDQVRLALKPVSPAWNDIMSGLFSGELKDARAEFTKYDEALGAALDAAIDVAAGQGAKISRDDFAFGNWDPTKDYTAADYKALG